MKCKICGKKYKHLGSHVYHSHGVTAKEYKQHFCLDYNFPNLLTNPLFNPILNELDEISFDDKAKAREENGVWKIKDNVIRKTDKQKKDFQKAHDLYVNEVEGCPKVSGYFPVFLDSKTTATNFVVDWNIINSEEDIAVFDENNNPLYFYIDIFSKEKTFASVFIYNDWVRDGTIQAQIAYGLKIIK